jgi:hypothetical protein
MLFDLRGAGRRTTVKAVYLLLALLMGGGLVLFGIGGDVSGGLVDAITERGATTDSGSGRYRDRVEEAQRKADANPKDAAAWAAVARARYQLAGAGDYFDQSTGQFTDQGKAQLRLATQAWERHVAVAGNKPDDSVASLMVQAYSQAGLNEPAKAVAAQEVITEARPKSATFANLAVLAYQANQTRKGDLATQEALDRAEKSDRNTLKSQLEQAKQQALQSQIQSQAQPSPTATAPPSGGKKKQPKGGGKG